MSSNRSFVGETDLMESAGVLGSTLGALLGGPEVATALTAAATVSAAFVGTLLIGGLLWVTSLALGKGFRAIRWQPLMDLFGLEDHLTSILDAVEGTHIFEDLKSHFIGNDMKHYFSGEDLAAATTTTEATTTTTTSTTTPTPTTTRYHYKKPQPYMSPQFTHDFYFNRGRWGQLYRDNELRKRNSN